MHLHIFSLFTFICIAIWNKFIKHQIFIPKNNYTQYCSLQRMNGHKMNGHKMNGHKMVVQMQMMVDLKKDSHCPPLHIRGVAAYGTWMCINPRASSGVATLPICLGRPSSGSSSLGSCREVDSGAPSQGGIPFTTVWWGVSSAPPLRGRGRSCSGWWMLHRGLRAGAFPLYWTSTQYDAGEGGFLYY